MTRMVIVAVMASGARLVAGVAGVAGVVKMMLRQRLMGVCLGVHCLHARHHLRCERWVLGMKHRVLLLSSGDVCMVDVHAAREWVVVL
jgi:hypothetical protein